MYLIVPDEQGAHVICDATDTGAKSVGHYTETFIRPLATHNLELSCGKLGPVAKERLDAVFKAYF